MQSGDVIASRFEVRRAAGSGGMSIVYRATDRLTGAPVAVKILRGCDTETHAARFAREGRLLARLDHPGIVRYVAHGATSTGERYLAIEWLEGEDLARRLRRATMTVAEGLSLAKRVARALGFAHEHGVLHRDIKPSNLFLQRGRVDTPKILDFGIARLRDAEIDLTAVGTRLGTPAYMSPEQARGNTNLDTRTDIFSLGCVLFQCLTRRRPFFGSDPTALIAKILLEEAPRVRQLRPEVPPELDDLIARMLDKKRSRRPPDGNAVAAELESMTSCEDGTTPEDCAAAVFTGSERRLHSVVMTYGITSPAALKRLGAVTSLFGGRFARLPDGGSVITLSGTDAATDLAAKAARCALAVQATAPQAVIALATGRDVMRAERATVGPVLDRVARLLRRADFTVPTRMLGNRACRRDRCEEEPDDTTATLDLDSQPIRLDEVTAGLLDGRFNVAVIATGEEYHLLGENAHTEITRTLLSRPTQCVAREAELGTLHALYSGCIDEPSARVALVVAGAGIGKSRLRQEFLRRLEADDQDFQVLLGHGDQLSAGAPFGVLATAFRHAAAIRDGEPATAQRQKMRARIARHLTEDVDQVAEFVGEMIGVPFPDHDSLKLRTARQDALLLGDQMRRAAITWLTAECRAIPTILVLEDLHWGDLPTTRFLDTALRALADEPFLVLALARPEIDDLFPQLWVDRGVHQIRLAPLSKRASRKLVRQVLGPEVVEATVTGIVDRAMGNAFFLEELIRAAAEDDTTRPPETVLAMLHSRLEKLEPLARRILRAASVFGRSFWRDGVIAILGDDDTSEVGTWLSALTEREIIVLHDHAKFHGQLEYAFRHDLVHEAAYAMLTDADRRAGHSIAGQWLERLGENDPVLLAEHFERGHQPGRAIAWYRRAAEQSMVSNDFTGACDHAERGVACGAAAEDLGALRLIQAEALNWQGDFSRAATTGLEAKEFLVEGTDSWYAAIGEIATAAGFQGDSGQLTDLFAALDFQPDPVASDRKVWAATRLVEQLIAAGLIDLGDTILIALRAQQERFDQHNPAVVGRILSAWAQRARFDGRAHKNLEYIDAAVERFERAGDLRNACTQRERAGSVRMAIGAHAEAERLLRQALVTAEQLGLQDVAATARTNLGLTLGRLGFSEEGYQIELEAAVAFRASGNRRMQCTARNYLALIRLEAGDARGAERDARLALEVADHPTPLEFSRALALAILARSLLMQEHVEAAFTAAIEALKILEQHGGVEEGESLIRVACAEALHAAGHLPTARQVIAAAHARILAQADRLDLEWRQRFLEDVPEHALALRYATEWATD